ncbi:hypothetical protein L226DRAFT_543799 [Lentinus tigrinus ALCF2SS1-7]|uniref:uncharacterized protein n=1 Tax=Lentinus tigrinus ALCF2SS1-7 TaxID=1328758 RepID=UPI00116601EB|nr:hypothetical protein L226DRAFT_543799 [Lentinus tigrinus ALCF2SS1-7]
MPDLPGPPSSDEDEHAQTPSMESREVQGDLTSLKTPRPPGAWMATPAPSRQVTKESVERTGSAPPPEFNSPASSDSGLATPPATLSRATSMPAQTPAPPGGWIATPAAGNTTRRGSILKVRFDLKAETASEVTTEGEDSLESRVEGDSQNAVTSAEAAPLNGDVSAGSSALAEESSAEPPPTPPSIRDRTRRKSPGIRIVDAFGREQVESAPQPAPQGSHTDLVVSDRKTTAPPTPRNAQRPARSATPRNRSGVRVVDAMGREIEEEPVVEEDSMISQTPLTHNEALSRIKDTLSYMKHELSDADRSSDDAIFDARMYAALQDQCKAAQDARSKISQSLQMAQSAESELKSKYSPFRNRIAKSVQLPIGGADIRMNWNPLNWRFVVGFIVVQLLLLALMYRYSLVQARKVFLTTYYDSFYPDLYIYLLKPDTTQHTIPSCPPWSIFTIFSTLQRAGFLGVVSEAWASASCAVSTYFQSTWVGWHYAQDTVPYSWPPT